MSDPLYDDIIKNIGMEIGNVIVTNDRIETSKLELHRDEYPKSYKDIIKASDCLIILWVKFLPDPISSDEWSNMATIIDVGIKRDIIKKFTDLRDPNTKSQYKGMDRRVNKPIRIF